MFTPTGSPGSIAVRWISVPLIVTMLVAMVTVHGEFGWQAIADPSAAFANERVLDASEKLERAREILQQHGNYDWLTENGSFAIVNNGIEFAATYLVMLVALFFAGAGRWLSLDFWFERFANHRPYSNGAVNLRSSSGTIGLQ